LSWFLDSSQFVFDRRQYSLVGSGAPRRTRGIATGSGFQIAGMVRATLVGRFAVPSFYSDRAMAQYFGLFALWIMKMSRRRAAFWKVAIFIVLFAPIYALGFIPLQRHFAIKAIERVGGRIESTSFGLPWIGGPTVP